MRPDARSFSFTWFRGQPTQQRNLLEVHNEENIPEHYDEDMEGVENLLNEVVEAVAKEVDNEPVEKEIENQEPAETEGKGYFLRKFGTSFAQFDRKYSTIESEKEEEVDNDTLPSTSSSKIKTSNVRGGSFGKRINKTVQDMRASLGNFSQKFRRSTRRRYRMETPNNDASPTRRILGRTPTKLYSPFGFDSPLNKTPKRLGTPSTPRLGRKNINSKTFSPVSKLNEATFKDLEDSGNFQISRQGNRRSVRF